MAEYVVLLLAPNSTARAQALTERLRAGVAELGLAPEHLDFPDPGAFASMPAECVVAAVYFGGAKRDRPSTDIVARLVRNGRPVLPVVADAGGSLAGYTANVPEALHGVNGFADDGTDLALDKIVNTVLEALGLIRGRRRVFISYRRTKSSGVAAQLAAALHAAGYLVFLDTQSVERAVIFQRALWDAMADTDLVLFLDTENTLESRWVAEEFAVANELGVTMLHVVWPGYDRPRVAELSEVMRLAHEDFWATAGPHRADGKLSKPAIGQILANVERLRAAAYASRRRHLVEGFVARVRRVAGEVHVDPGGHLEVKRQKGGDAIVVPVIGALESMHVEDAALTHEASAKEVRVLYRARGLNKRRLQHVTWLDAHLPIKLLELEGVPGWLAKS